MHRRFVARHPRSVGDTRGLFLPRAISLFVAHASHLFFSYRFMFFNVFHIFDSTTRHLCHFAFAIRRRTLRVHSGSVFHRRQLKLAPSDARRCPRYLLSVRGAPPWRNPDQQIRSARSQAATQPMHRWLLLFDRFRFSSSFSSICVLLSLTSIYILLRYFPYWKHNRINNSKLYNQL